MYLTPYSTTYEILIMTIEWILFFIFICFIAKFFREPTRKEWRITKLERRIRAYISKMENLNKLKKLIENKDFDSINNILIKYVPANKEEFIKLQNQCSKNEENIYRFLAQWIEKEKHSVEHILNQLNLELKTEQEKKEITKKFYD